MTERTDWDDEDERLAGDIARGIEERLGDRVVLEISWNGDGYPYIDVSTPSSAEPILLVHIGAGEVHVTDYSVVSEESDDLDPHIDRCSWAVDLVVNLALFGAARVRTSRWSPRSFNRLHLFGSAEERRTVLDANAGMIVAESRPLVDAPSSGAHGPA